MYNSSGIYSLLQIWLLSFLFALTLYLRYSHNSFFYVSVGMKFKYYQLVGACVEIYEVADLKKIQRPECSAERIQTLNRVLSSQLLSES